MEQRETAEPGNERFDGASAPASICARLAATTFVVREPAAVMRGRRGIPARHLIHVSFVPGMPQMRVQDFARGFVDHDRGG